MELFERAQKLHLAGQLAEAERIYDDLLTQNHDNPGLLATVGTLMLQTDRIGLAISLLERASKQTPQEDILANLAIAYKQSGQYKKCKDVFKEALKHDPSAKTLADYAALFVNVGTPEEAIKHASKSLKADPNCHMGHWNMGIAKLEAGMWDTAWEHWEHGFQTTPVMRIDRKISGKPYWDGTPGKRLAIYGEQGIGDEIMFASILPEVLKDNTIVFECHQRLVTLFKNSFPGMPIYGTREEKADLILWPQDHEIDAQVSIGSLGKFYRRKREDFNGHAYLKADTASRGNKFRVGISWTGGLKPGRIRTREVPLPWWKDILDNDCEFISLQYTDCQEELEHMERVGYDIQTFDAVKAHDYNETAKLVMSCDLVISVCTSVVHLAGALGVPCWCMTPNKPAWRYGVTGGMPWYRSVRLYRQPQEGSWMPVIQKVGIDLSDLLNEKVRKTA
jgi:tetratricopeptide (TPR) repeat protein